jgi:formate hydrogenlyase subunit 3/multisubunit Na+/H+ antiporter MnhD subunit
VTALITGQAPTLSSARTPPVGGLMLRLDGLGALFLVIIGLVGLASAICGFGYGANYEGRYSLRMAGAMLNQLLLALGLQVMADNALTFLIA